MPSYQYTGVPDPPGPFTFGVARALVLMLAAFDRETCPHYDCGYSGAGVSSGQQTTQGQPPGGTQGTGSGTGGTGQGRSFTATQIKVSPYRSSVGHRENIPFMVVERIDSRTYRLVKRNWLSHQNKTYQWLADDKETLLKVYGDWMEMSWKYSPRYSQRSTLWLPRIQPEHMSQLRVVTINNAQYLVPPHIPMSYWQNRPIPTHCQASDSGCSGDITGIWCDSGDFYWQFLSDKGSSVSSGSGATSSSTVNLVQQGNFSGFGRRGGPWGTGLYSNNGIWWNSKGARSSARVVNLNTSDPLYTKGIKTALHIENRSSRGAHVYGTTSQRIRVTPGRLYRISLWAAAKGLNSNGGVNITVDPQWRIRPIHLKGGSYNWTKYSGTFTADNSGYIDLRIISEDRGAVFLTGLEMQRAGQ
ncbi:MAG: hypothetical protein A2Y65_11320 [Deltaproteobacteria bacterium RBG_13_52_11]|nr:MAG: hypothetical protein A2Y65_11320 [Deltaproteobacteria bacterium RBG_13_52_11]